LDVPRVVDLPLDEARLLAMTGSRQDVYLYDGDALSAADLILQMRRSGIEAVLWGGPALGRTQIPLIAGHFPGAARACYAIAAPLYASSVPGTQTPDPWAALAYDAATLLLDAIERDVLAHGRATRDGVGAQLGWALEPGGQPVFVEEQRRKVDVVFYCYPAGQPYPGQMVMP
jgi:hypothetical protein